LSLQFPFVPVFGRLFVFGVPAEIYREERPDVDPPLMPFIRGAACPVRGDHCHLIGGAAGVSTLRRGLPSSGPFAGLTARSSAGNLMQCRTCMAAAEGIWQRLGRPTSPYGSSQSAPAWMIAMRAYHQHAADTQRFEIITFNNAFHGRTLATISASDQEKMHKGFMPLLRFHVR
jgi:acetylornithine/N-succinyldiaminopimelate aminotransferase